MYNRVEQPSDITILTAIRPVNKCFAGIDDYHNCRFIEKSARYDDDVASKLNKMTKITAMQMNNQTFSCKGPVSTITF